MGYQALKNNTGGAANTAIGVQALFNNLTGNSNVAVGNNALGTNATGNDNTALGTAAGPGVTGSNNTILGFNAGGGSAAANNVICIGTDGQNIDNSCYIGNIYTNVRPIVGTDPDSVTVRSSGKLGRGNVSSRRYKHDVQPMASASEALFKLKPVSFRYNKEYDATQTTAFGLIAEDVAEVYPDLVGRNAKGQPESVHYDMVNAMLLNEFLKEHHQMQDLKATIAKQQKQIEALTAGLRKVSAQLEASNPAPQVVNNP